MQEHEFAPKPLGAREPWDIAIIGSGAAALTAAIYTTRGAASTLILGGDAWGGQLMLTTTVDNYPAIPGVQGPDLMEKMKAHALMFGAEFVQRNVSSVDFSKKPFELTVSDKKYLANSLIIATGADTKWLGVDGEDKLRGRGVSSCAPCDAPFFKDKNVAVVGGGDSAMEEALVLTKFASSVTMIHRRDAFKASAVMQKKVFDQEAKGKVKILWNTEIVEFLGEEKLEKIKIKNNKSGEISEMSIEGVFVAIGHIPATEMFKNKLELDERGYVVRMPTEHMGDVVEEKHFHTKTNIEGVFVAGDVHDHVYRQAVTAAGFGCMAGMDALRFLDKHAPSW